MEFIIEILFNTYVSCLRNHPLMFLILPAVVSGIFGTGILFLHPDISPNEPLAYLSSDVDQHDQLVETSEEFEQCHNLQERFICQLIFNGVKHKNILHEDALLDILRLHNQCIDFEAKDETFRYTFSNLCVTYGGRCKTSNVLTLIDFNSSRINNVSIHYPLHELSSGEEVYIGNELEEVDFHNNTDQIKSANILKITFQLKCTTPMEEQLCHKFESHFHRLVKSFHSSKVYVKGKTSHDVRTELAAKYRRALMLSASVFALVVVISICSCLLMDWTKPTPWLASIGMVSSWLACVTGFGLMGYLNVPYVDVVGSTPFVITGVACVNVFRLATTVHRIENDNLLKVASDIAVSSLLTLTFYIAVFGAYALITSFRCVYLTCIYIGVCWLCLYVYQITLLATWCVLSNA